jgi:hypothetical protein
MSQHTIRRHCSYCQQNRPFNKQGVNHILHFLLSVFTAGIWLIVVWIPLGLLSVFRPYRCTTCGKAKF